MTLQSLTVLDELVAGVREDLAADQAALPERELSARAKDAPPAQGLLNALRMPPSGLDPDGGRVRVIAEVKQASPSQGVIARAFDPGAIARRYEAGGAAAISVLTERRRFLGSMDHLRAVRAAVRLPVLRKDFIFDPYQVVEARAGGADAILLIAAILETHEMEDLRLQAEDLGMDALVEVYAGEEMDRALAAGARLLGVNNRNLKTFEVDAGHTLRVFSRLPAPRRGQLVLVSESGILGWKDVAPLAGARVDAVLVGEALMRAPSPEGLLAELRGLPARAG